MPIKIIDGRAVTKEVAPNGLAQYRIWYRFEGDDWMTDPIIKGALEVTPRFRLDLQPMTWWFTPYEGQPRAGPKITVFDWAEAKEVVLTTRIPSNWKNCWVAVRIVIIGYRGVKWTEEKAFYVAVPEVPPPDEAPPIEYLYCDVCGTRFETYEKLLQHYATVHPDKTPPSPEDAAKPPDEIDRKFDLDSIVEWVKENPILAGGIGVGILLLIRGR